MFNLMLPPTVTSALQNISGPVFSPRNQTCVSVFRQPDLDSNGPLGVTGPTPQEDSYLDRGPISPGVDGVHPTGLLPQFTEVAAVGWSVCGAGAAQQRNQEKNHCCHLEPEGFMAL